MSLEGIFFFYPSPLYDVLFITDVPDMALLSHGLVNISDMGPT